MTTYHNTICNLKVPFSGKLLETFAWKRGLVKAHQAEEDNLDDTLSVSSRIS